MPASSRALTARPWWPWFKRIATGTFFLLVGGLLIQQAREIEWQKVVTTVRDYPAGSLAAAASFALASHLLYSCLDLFGRRHTAHGLPVTRVMLLTFVSYAFNLNFGSLIGGLAFRYRLYARLGLSLEKTTEVAALSILTNWLGYALVAGILFAALPFTVPADWPIGAAAIRFVGALLVTTAIVYVMLCAFSPKRVWTIRTYTLHLPTGQFALAQLAVSATSWLLIGGTIHALLRAHAVGYPMALAVLLAAAVAGVITYVPAGLGVLEAVFIALLAPGVPKNDLLAALLAYRGLYYWAPLALAIVVYLLLETSGNRKLQTGAD